MLLMAEAPTLKAELTRAGKELSGLCPALLCRTPLAGQVWGSSPLLPGLSLGTRTFRVLSQGGLLLPSLSAQACVHPTAQFSDVGEVRGNRRNAPSPLTDQLYLHRSLSATLPSPFPSSFPFLPSPLPGPLPFPLLPCHPLVPAPSLLSSPPPHPLTGPQAPAPPPALSAVNPPLALGRGFLLPSRSVPALLFRRG